MPGLKTLGKQISRKKAGGAMGAENISGMIYCEASLDVTAEVVVPISAAVTASATLGASVTSTPAAAIGFTSLATYADTTGGTSASTSSYTPSANALVLAVVINTRASNPNEPTFSGNGLTWVKIGTAICNTIAAFTTRITLFRAMGASPTSGAGTASTGAQSATGHIIRVVEFTGVDTSGTNGSGAIVQFKTGNADSGANPAITLDSAISNASNAVFAAFASSANPFGGTAETDWIEDMDTGYATPTTGGYTVYRIATTDNSVAVTAAAANWAGIAVEIKKA